MTDRIPRGGGPELPAVKWGELLASTFPGQERQVTQLSERWNDANWALATPALQMFCESLTCARQSFYDFVGSPPSANYNQWTPLFLFYRCRHCKQTEKLYAVLVRVVRLQGTVRERAIKLGEVPPFGPDLSGKLNPLLEPARDFVLKAQRCESYGLGLAAFHYYRRVVETQLPHWLEQIAQVCDRIGTDERVIGEIRAAALGDNTLDGIVAKIGNRLPSILRMSGHDPLALLRTAFAEGGSVTQDDKALEVAASIRVILTDFTDRIYRALKDHTEVTYAVKRLLQARPGASP